MHCGIDHKETLAHTHFNTSLHSKDKLDQDSNYVKPLDTAGFNFLKFASNALCANKVAHLLTQIKSNND